MLDYEWSTGQLNPSSVMISADDPPCPDPSHGHPMVDQYATTAMAASTLFFPGPAEPSGSSTFLSAPFHLPHHHQQSGLQHNLLPFYESRSYGPSSSDYHSAPGQFYHEPFHCPDTGLGQFIAVPKTEDHVVQSAPGSVGEYTARIGLNLGGRTYFSSAEDDFVSRLYRRSRPLEAGSNSQAKAPRCQAEGCNTDLTHAKHYHRRHKVCEFHSKAAAVIAAGLTQRFCQQCSRFHLLSEFDNGKRSCRKRLADHNRRRRKSHQQPNLEINKPSLLGGRSALMDSLARSQQESGNQSSSSVTVAVSPPRMSLDCCFR